MVQQQTGEFAASVRRLKEDSQAFDKVEEEAEKRLDLFRWPRHKDINASCFLRAVVGFTIWRCLATVINP
jgi:hypothetical protein